MDGIDDLKGDLKQGRIDPERLIDLLASSQRRLQDALQRIAELEKRIAELEKASTGVPVATPPKVDQAYSTRAEEKRQQAHGQKPPRHKKNKKRRGRVTSAEKIAQAQRSEDVFPQGVDANDCRHSHTRPVWRLEDGKAVLIAYRVFRAPDGTYGPIPGVLARGEFGMEILLEVAYLTYVMGLSFDKVCQMLEFFQQLHLSKTQVDALLHRLAKHWENEFETLCTLLANSLVVHTDETSWSIKSVWAFLSEKARLLFFGVNKDADTLAKILDPTTFAGLVISDDAAVYGNFTQAQKCWAHLLRKAIKLTLQDPDNTTYRAFTDRLLEIYRSACRVQRDGRLGDAGRARKVAELDEAILDLCAAMWAEQQPVLQDETEDAYRLLSNEVMRLMLNKELFAFVTTPAVTQPNQETAPVSGTNNEAERTLRGPAQARDVGRTNKTLHGARRRTIVASVLESLRVYLPVYTLESVLAEVRRWREAGRSCFESLLKQLKLKVPEQSVLDQVYPQPSG